MHCDIHNVEMHEFNKDGKTWYSHETDDERYKVASNGKRYCYGKPPLEAKSKATVSPETIRMRCLKQAHEVYSVKSPDEISSDGILALARKYEKYILEG